MMHIMKYCCIVILILLLTVSAYSQDLIEDSYNPFAIHQDEMREWVDAFNAQNVNPRSYNKSDQTHQLDSLITIFSQQINSSTTTKLEFDLTEERDISYFSILESGSWMPSTFSVNDYDKNNRRLFSYRGDWDGDFNNVSKDDGTEFQTFIYNDQGLLSEHHIQDRERYDLELPFILITHEYNAEGLLIRSQSEQWLAALDSFQLLRQFDFHYKDGLLDYFVDYSLDSQRGFVSTDSIVYFHNERNLEKENKILKEHSLLLNGQILWIEFLNIIIMIRYQESKDRLDLF